MKNLFLTVMVLFAFTAISFGQSVVGTPHDMSGSAWNTAAANKICGTCHTPHNAVTPQLAPLWSHAATASVFTLYSSPTMDAAVAQPTASSKACLSCHDGTVALDNFVPLNGVTTPMGAVPANLGTDISNDHPISFTYNTALATTDGGLEDPSVALSGLGGTIDADMLFAGQMQCASCHNPHNNTNGSFQRMTNTNSELCLTCHIK